MLPAFPEAARAPPPPSERMRAFGLSVRPARIADLPFLRALYASTRARELALVRWPAAQRDAFLADQFRLQHLHFTRFHADADFWVIEQRLAAGAIGRLYLDRSARIWRIVEIALMPAARGQGLGGALLDWVQRAAGEHHAGGVDLHVAITNPAAAALYARHGFRETPETPDSEPPGTVASEARARFRSATHRRLLWCDQLYTA